MSDGHKGDVAESGDVADSETIDTPATGPSRMEQVTAMVSWIQGRVPRPGQFLLALLAGIASAAFTFQGLVISLSYGMSKNMSIAAGLFVGLLLVTVFTMFWNWVIDEVREYGATAVVILAFLVFIPFTFAGSTIWNTAALAGGYAYTLDLEDTVENWRVETIDGFATSSQQLSDLHDLMSNTCTSEYKLYLEEYKGRYSRMGGIGVLSGTYKIASDQACAAAGLQIVDTDIEDDIYEVVPIAGAYQAPLVRAIEDQEAAQIQIMGLLDALVLTMQQESDPSILRDEFTQTKQEVEGHLINAFQGFNALNLVSSFEQARPTDEVINEIDDNRAERLRTHSKALDAIIADLRGYEESRSRGGLTPPKKVAGPLKACFKHWMSILHLWGLAFFIDYAPLVLLVMAWAGFKRRKLQLKGINEQAEEAQTELDEKKAGYDGQIAEQERLLEQAKANAAAQQRQIREEAEADLATVREETVERRAELDVLNTQIAATDRRVFDANFEADEKVLEAQANADNKVDQIVKDAKTKADSDLAETQAQLETAQAELKEVQEAREGLETLNPVALFTELTDKKRELGRVNAEHAELVKQNGELRTELENKSKEISDRDIEIKRLQGVEHDLRIKLDASGKRIASLEARLAERDASLKARTEQIAELQPQADRAVELDAELDHTRTDLERMTVRNGQLRDDVSKLGVEVARLTNDCEVKRGQIDNLQSEKLVLETDLRKEQSARAALNRSVAIMQSSVLTANGDSEAPSKEREITIDDEEPAPEPEPVKKPEAVRKVESTPKPEDEPVVLGKPVIDGADKPTEPATSVLPKEEATSPTGDGTNPDGSGPDPKLEEQLADAAKALEDDGSPATPPPDKGDGT